MANLIFNDENIEKLFGSEDAQYEDPERLKSYFFRNKIHQRLIARLPLRILVGHKGIGKSASIRIAIADDLSQGILPILIKPDDVDGLGKAKGSFLETAREWREGLIKIIAKKTLEEVGVVDASDRLLKLTSYGGKLVVFLSESFKNAKFNEAPAFKMALKAFTGSFDINIYIDDLDRGWEGDRESIIRISALLSAIRDINSDNPSIRFKIALRTDVYFLVRTSDESTDKIEGSVIWYSWTNHEILVLLIKRIESFFGRTINEQELLNTSQPLLNHYLTGIMDPSFNWSGKWEKAPMYRVLMTLIRKRPRDLVKLCSLSAHRARDKNKNIISTIELKDSFEQYSQGRITDTINEYRSELPEVERLILGMRPTEKEWREGFAFLYSNDALFKKLDNIIQQGKFNFVNKSDATQKNLAQFLYKINFLTARFDSAELIQRKYFEENRYLSSDFVDFGCKWEVHPAYRWALGPHKIAKAFDDLLLDRSSD